MPILKVQIKQFSVFIVTVFCKTKPPTLMADYTICLLSVHVAAQLGAQSADVCPVTALE